MAVGRPVVFACDSAYDPVAQTGAGITVPPNDPERIAEAMVTLATTPEADRRAMGAAADHTSPGITTCGRSARRLWRSSTGGPRGSRTSRRTPVATCHRAVPLSDRTGKYELDKNY